MDTRLQGAFHVYKVVVGFRDIGFSGRIGNRIRGFIRPQEQPGYLRGILLNGFRAAVRRNVDIADCRGVATLTYNHLMVVL